MKNLVNYILVMLIFTFFISSCQIIQPINEEKRSKKVSVEAYQFRAKLRQKRNPASFNLNIFQTDSIIAFTAKGYMNKGAMKGIITPDSLMAYFPLTNEHVAEELNEFFQKLNCSGKAPNFNLFRLFFETPEFLRNNSDAIIDIVDLEPDQVKYNIRFYNCEWYLDIAYDRKDNGWRIYEFKFSDGESTTLNGKRHQYNQNAKVKRSFFEYSIPYDAIRITP